MKTIYVVTYGYNYEGESLEAVYNNRKSAKEHPYGGDYKMIYKMNLLTKMTKNPKKQEIKIK